MVGYMQLFMTFLLYYLRILGVNWQQPLTLSGVKLKLGSVIALVKLY